MSLVESREWVGPAADTLPDRPTARLHATGAVLFATLELPRALVVQAAGSWQPTQAISVPRPGLGMRAGRCVSWLLGR